MEVNSSVIAQNITHVHKDNNDLLSIIITLGTNIRRGKTVFYEEVKPSDLGDIGHVQKHLHGRIILFHLIFFMKVLFGEDSKWLYTLFSKKQIFVHFYLHGDLFYNRYMNKTIKTKYLDNNGSRVKPGFFFAKTGIKCSFIYN